MYIYKFQTNKLLHKIKNSIHSSTKFYSLEKKVKLNYLNVKKMPKICLKTT